MIITNYAFITLVSFLEDHKARAASYLVHRVFFYLEFCEFKTIYDYSLGSVLSKIDQNT
jgi:hypothetical protein